MWDKMTGFNIRWQEVGIVSEKPLGSARRRRSGWLMSDTYRKEREFEAVIERRKEYPTAKPVKQPDQLYDEIEIEEEER